MLYDFENYRFWLVVVTESKTVDMLSSYHRLNNIVKTAFFSDHVLGKPVLDWSRRKKIALGTARGLLYLHEQCDPRIIHRDVKAANILLDEEFEAVVGDFGLAKLLDNRESHVTTAVRGTVGHIAPEYLSTGQSSEKTDVFGFGILLLELVTGQKALDFGRAANQKGVMLDWVYFLSHTHISISFLSEVLFVFRNEKAFCHCKMPNLLNL